VPISSSVEAESRRLSNTLAAEVVQSPRWSVSASDQPRQGFRRHGRTCRWAPARHEVSSPHAVPSPMPLFRETVSDGMRPRPESVREVLPNPLHHPYLLRTYPTRRLLDQCRVKVQHPETRDDDNRSRMLLRTVRRGGVVLRPEQWRSAPWVQVALELRSWKRSGQPRSRRVLSGRESGHRDAGNARRSPRHEVTASAAKGS
jgi:hypothetical protein